MEQALLDLESFEALFDQCRLGLCDDQGNPHKKPTKFCTSSAEFAQAFDGLRCLKDHVHRPVLGGRRITSAAGIYPRGLAKALVSGIEAQFVKEFKTCQEVLMTDDGPQPELPGVTKADHSESEEELVSAEDQPKISAEVKLAVKKLHDATGHRDNRQLARALVLAGAQLKLSQLRKPTNVTCALSSALQSQGVLHHFQRLVTQVIKFIWIWLKFLMFMNAHTGWFMWWIGQPVFRWLVCCPAIPLKKSSVFCVRCGGRFLDHPESWLLIKPEN